ncbi:VCBS repeat-containing protein [Halobacillus yeomjeoni]|nr:VCBS repeat-containing protein [Halobacillus yeomjeoni]
MFYHPYPNHQFRMAANSYILSFKKGDVNGDYIEDSVYLIGQRSSDSPYNTNITLVVQDGRTSQLYTIPLKTNQAYQPRLFLGDFTGNGVNDILISMDSGGSGGFGYYYIYSFLNNIPQLIFDYERFDAQSYIYKVIYRDNYKVEIINDSLELSFIIDLSNRSPQYLAEIYNEDGTLKEPLEGSVSGLNQLYPIDFDGDGVYEIEAVQRIIGRYNADELGIIETPLKWNTMKFDLFFDNQAVSVMGQPKNA